MKTPKDRRVVYLISCVKSKRRGPLRAKDLYRSVWFRKAKEYVEGLDQPWAILSAKHYLLSPDKVIRSYNKTLNSMPFDARRIWSDRVVRKIHLKYRSGDTIVLLAGKKYREQVVPQLKAAGFLVRTPLARMGIGQQLRWFNEKVNDSCEEQE